MMHINNVNIANNYIISNTITNHNTNITTIKSLSKLTNSISKPCLYQYQMLTIATQYTVNDYASIFTLVILAHIIKDIHLDTCMNNNHLHSITDLCTYPKNNVITNRIQLITTSNTITGLTISTKT